MEIFLRKNVVENKTITNDGLTVYVALRKLMNKKEKEYYVSYNLLAFTLYGNTNFNKRFISHIKEGLQNLIDMELVKIIPINKTSTIIKNEFVLDLSKLFFEIDNVDNTKDYFIKIYLSEVHKIMRSNKDKFNLLKCFICTIGSIDYGAKVYVDISYKNVEVGYMTQEYLGSLCGLNQVDYYKYSVELENLGVLYIRRNEDFYLDGDTPKRLANCYGRPCDKNLINLYSTKYSEMKDSVDFKCNKEMTTKKANYKKSLAMKFNEMLKGKDYSKEETLGIYNYVLTENKKYTALYNKHEDENYLEKIRDVDVFRKYDFIKFEEDKP